MKKRIIFLAIILLLVNAVSVTILAAIPPGVHSTALLATFIKQEKSLWCWAASAENAVRCELWENLPERTQRDAVRYLKGTLFNSYPNVSGNFNDIKEAAEYISMDTLEYTTSGKKTY